MTDIRPDLALALTLVDQTLHNGQLPDNSIIQIRDFANTTDQPHESLIALTAFAITQWANALTDLLGTQEAANHIDTLRTRLDFAIITDQLELSDD